jgi:hypothetical protein
LLGEVLGLGLIAIRPTVKFQPRFLDPVEDEGPNIDLPLTASESEHKYCFKENRVKTMN